MCREEVLTVTNTSRVQQLLNPVVLQLVADVETKSDHQSILWCDHVIFYVINVTIYVTII